VPENLTNPKRWRDVSTFEGWFYRLRFHPDRGLLRLMAHDPEDAFTAAELGLRTGLLWLPDPKLPPAMAEMRARDGGHLHEPGPALTTCPEILRPRAPDPAWVDGLRRRYSRAATQVLVDVAPEADCDNSFAFYRARTGPGVTDNRLETLPVDEYTATGRLHVDDRGAKAISERIAAQIAQRMAKLSPGSGPGQKGG
jgi:hypothetical protein